LNQQGPAALTNKKKGNFDQIGAEKRVRSSVTARNLKSFLDFFPEGGASEILKNLRDPLLRIYLLMHVYKSAIHLVTQSL
jgi:hypothetical protein